MATAEQLITKNLDIWTSAVQTKSAAGRGKANKLELYGVKKLRELILELAVRGLLVPQDPNDEPASELLKKIAAEKAQLVKDRKIKKQKPLVPIKDDEEPFDIPANWRWIRLPESYYAISPGKKKLKSSEIKESGNYPVVDQGQEHISGFSNDKTLVIEIPGPLVVFGDHTRNIKYIDFDFVPGADGTKILCPFLIFPRYFYTYLQHYDLEGRGYARHFKVLNDNLIAIPPVEEQVRIVAKVDELMGICDQLEQHEETSITAHQTLVQTLLDSLTTASERDGFSAAWAKIADHFDTLFTTEWSIDQLKQTILQLAVMGKLVPQDPNDESASELLKRITSEKAKLIKEGKIKKQKELMPTKEDEKPFELPLGWKWARIGEASISTDYGLSDKASTGEEGVPVLAMGHIQSGKVLLEAQKVVSRTIDSLPELYLENRDLLYNRTNSADLVGKTGIFLGKDKEYTFASYLIRIRTVKQNQLPEFLNINMLTPKFRTTQIEPHLKQQCGQANVNGTIMKNMLVAVAPESEITRIVAKVDELMEICDRLKDKLITAQNTQLLLTDKITDKTIQ